MYFMRGCDSNAACLKAVWVFSRSPDKLTVGEIAGPLTTAIEYGRREVVKGFVRTYVDEGALMRDGWKRGTKEVKLASLDGRETDEDTNESL
jgi:hypothetical protein